MIKKTLLTLSFILSSLNAGVVSGTSDSKGWNSSEKSATSMAKTHLANKIGKICRQSSRRVIYNSLVYSVDACKQKEVGSEVRWNCNITGSIKCISKEEVLVKCNKSQKELFKIEEVSGPKQNVLKIRNTSSGTLYTINRLTTNDKQVSQLLCGKTSKNESQIMTKIMNKVKKYIEKENKMKEKKRTVVGNGVRG